MKYKITFQKEKLIMEDIEKYLMGQIQMQYIAKKREVPYHIVKRLLDKIIAQKMVRSLIKHD